MKLFSALLLGGGASTRMGRPKALVEVKGVPLWRRQAALLQALGPSELLISAGTDWAPGPGPWTVVRDRVSGLGPLGGIEAALGALSTDLLLVLAVDMPAMSGAFLGRLLAGAGPAGVVPEDNGLYQGLAAVYPRTVAPLVSELLAGGDRSLQLLVRRAQALGLVRPFPVSAADGPLFLNINTPGDL